MTTYVWSVNTQTERDKMVSVIYDKLTKEPSTKFVVAREGVSTVIVYEIPSKIAIRKYAVVVVPVTINLSALDHASGNVVYNLDETITALQRLIQKVQLRQGKHFVKGNSNVEALEQALGQLAR